jgi:transcription elongation factor GreA
MEEQIISPEGYEKLKNELNHLTTVKRKEIAGRIEKAKELGDLSENAEYHDAKDAQGFNEGRISKINGLLKNVVIVENNKSKDKVAMGSTVTISDGRKERKFTIVSFNECDPAEGKISNESPIGLALSNKKKGDSVKINTPRGIITYEIKKIE